MPAPAELSRSMDAAVERAGTPAPGAARALSGPLLRVDAWAFARPGSSSVPIIAGEAPSYGGSQIGGVWSYRFDRADVRRLSAYMRAVTTLSGVRETDAALGLSARPVPKVPVTAHAEIRATRVNGRTLIRPQAFVTGQARADKLPLGVKIEAYGQAGYVGGKFATAFADGQVLADREIASFDLVTVRTGAGVWAGAQRGASRIDVGPRISADFKLAEAPVRVSLDYRTRIGGNAQPESGIAVTVSTGF